MYFNLIFLLLLINFTGIAQAENASRVVQRSAVAQIRFPEKTHTVVPSNPVPVVNPPVTNPNPPVVNSNPPTSTPTTTVSNPVPSTVNQFDLILNLIPNSKLGIFYDSSKPIDVNNPVRIYNTRSGGYTSVYFDRDGFLQFSVGVVPNNFNDLKALGSNSTVNPKDLEFTNSATLSTYYSESEVNLSNVKTTNNTSLSMDTLPRFNKRYGLVSRTTRTPNGIIIPAGSIVVGTKQANLENIHRPEFSEFENLRFYSPDGVLINIAGENGKNNLDCGLNKAAGCMDFEKFYTPVGTTEFGAKVAATYNPKQFFPGKSAQEANNLWLKIQKDLEANTVLDINSANESWLERIFKDLNEQEEVYIGNLLNNLSKIELLRTLFAYDPNSSQKDSTAKTLYDKQFDTLYDFAKAKQAVWDLELKINGASGTLKQTLSTELQKLITTKQNTKANFEKARDEYTQYIKKGTEVKTTSQTSTTTTTTKTTTSTTSSSNTNQSTTSTSSSSQSTTNKNTNKKKK